MLQSNEADTSNPLLIGSCIVEHAQQDWQYLLRRNNIIDAKYLKKLALSIRPLFHLSSPLRSHLL